MKIASVRIENFRSFKDSTIQFNDFACLVGPNGSGKSTILIALSVFFREYENIPTNLHQLGIEDFHRKNTNKPIKITVTFKDLSSEAASDFAGYVRHGQLIVSAEATYNKETGKAEVKQYGQRLGMPDFAPFFKAVGEGKRVAELKELYNGLRETYDDLPGSGTKAAMQGALQVYEADNPGRCVPIPSEDQFYGFSRGANRLAKHVQWVYVPAVKDASGEQVEARNSALGRLLSRTVRLKTRFVEELATLRTNTQDQYQELLNDNQGALDEISKSLERRLRVWAHPRARMQLQWRQDSDKSVRVEEPWAHIVAGEGGFDGELARFGHGLQRSFLFALLQELADTDDSSAPTLILACEEPELYQHPPQARHLAFVLDNLSRDHSQVIVTTHSPFFVSVSRESFEDVRMVRKDSDRNYSVVAYTSFEEIAKDVEEVSTRPTRPEGVLAMIHQALQPALTEMFFTRRLILVEGLEDIAYILSYIRLLDKSEEFRQLGCHIVPANGKSKLLQPVAIAMRFGIPTYLVFDADANKEDINGSRTKHKKDNKALLQLAGVPNPDPMPTDTLWGHGVTMWHSEVGSIVEAEIGKDDWEKSREKADVSYSHSKGLRKNTLHIGTSLKIAWDAGKKSQSLVRLCNRILDPENVMNS